MTDVLPLGYIAPEERHLSISAWLERVLSTIVGTFEQAGVPLPDRRYWTVGAVVVDCEQLTVHLTQAYKGLPGDDPGIVQRCDSARTVVMVVQLFRCVPTGNGQRPPAPTLIEASAEQLAVDSWVLMDAAEAVDADSFNTGIMAEVNVIPPEGGYAGMSLTLTTPIP